MRFRSDTGKPVQLSLTSGHTAVVGTEFTELPAMFQRLAIAEGLIPEGTQAADAAPKPGPSKADLIQSAMKKMLDLNSPDAFTTDGKPDVRKLSDVAGFTVSREERDANWKSLADSMN
jgi:hypothetical protein